MQGDSQTSFDERTAGLAMIGTIFFGTSTGTGIGIFFQQAEIGAIAGAALGILLGLWLIPGLRDVRG